MKYSNVSWTKCPITYLKSALIHKGNGVEAYCLDYDLLEISFFKTLLNEVIIYVLF